MKDHLAIIEAFTKMDGFPVVEWCESAEAAEKFISKWLHDNSKTRPEVRTTIAKCVFCIVG